MKKFVCTVCGYVYEGEAAPEKCPVCGVGADKFTEVKEGEREWAAEHVVGVAKGVSEDILADHRANFEGECSEVGMYLAMARVAHREGYPEIGLFWEKAVYDFFTDTVDNAYLMLCSPRGFALFSYCHLCTANRANIDRFVTFVSAYRTIILLSHNKLLL